MYLKLLKYEVYEVNDYKTYLPIHFIDQHKDIFHNYNMRKV